jgi:hypothetical protein
MGVTKKRLKLQQPGKVIRRGRSDPDQCQPGLLVVVTMQVPGRLDHDDF